MWLQNFAFDGFAAHFAVVKWAFGLRNGTGVPRGGFAATKFFVGGFLWLRNGFAGDPLFGAKPQFRRMVLLAAKFFHRGSLFSQGDSLGYEIFAGEQIPLFLCFFGSLWLPFVSFEISPDFHHSKSLSYIKIT